MGPHLEQKGESKTGMDISATKEDGMLPQDPQDKTMLCASNYEDHSFDMEASYDGQVNVPNGREDMEVDILDCTNSSQHGLTEANCQDATENSSSFGDTVSGADDGSTLSDHEVESQLYVGNALPSLFDGCGGAVQRKKKLTDHWRKFIRPLVWRCKWVELRIREFQSQAQKYDRELAEYDQRKQLEYEKFTSEGFDTKSQPFSSLTQRSKVMKRKKRKRVEEMTDIPSYMSHHNLFSYYEFRKSVPDGALVNDYCNIDHKTINGNDEFCLNDGGSFTEFGDGNNHLEQILWKIEVAQSEARKLKSRIDKVVSEYPGKFSSVNRLSWLAPCDALTRSDQNPASPPENGDKMAVRSLYTSSQHISEGNTGDLLMPESAVSSHGEVTPLSDMIVQSTEQPSVRGPSDNAGEGILAHDQAAKEELHNFERVLNQLTEKPEVLEESPVADPPTSKSKTSNKKRKRGKRKSGTSGWKRRSSS